MRSLVVISACAALVIGSAAQAQQAAPPAAPPPYGESINLEQARTIVDAAMAEAKKNNWLMAITVVGPAGDLVYFAKMDNTQHASVTISQHKARAAAIFRRPTKAFEENLSKGFEFLYHDPRRHDRLAGRGAADLRRQADRGDRLQRRRGAAGSADLHGRGERPQIANDMPGKWMTGWRPPPPSLS